ncbi:rod shape-determining protein MreD [Actinocorallia sp. API 0066]|uniref:rod shape-determining protein MreD n=1 Tax=Actinocorallia sp. API 0066 TaxID=2896846 RepID=UPI001E30B557|nr:rod shape-determining protein MreD [Actinocorallia sp. API 0066]MCD0452866.1 rod shape-determining protein MreD [Actinocorallia sp. API 0066]
MRTPAEEAQGVKLRAFVIIVVAIVVQVTAANRLPLPGGVTPDLVLLTVVALALFSGERVGMVAGFCAGLAVDIAPPADHTIGRYALVYCLIGYGCGLLRADVQRSPLLPFVMVGVGALLGNLAYALVGMMLGDPRTSWAAVSRMVPLAVLYDVLASPFVVWAVLRLSRRSERLEPRGGLSVPGYAKLGRQQR